MSKLYTVKESNIKYIFNSLRKATSKYYMFRKEMTCKMYLDTSEMEEHKNVINSFKNPFSQKSSFICVELLEKEKSTCIRMSSSATLGDEFIIIRPGDEITFKKTGLEIVTNSTFRDSDCERHYSELTINNLIINPFKKVKNLEEMENVRKHQIAGIELRFRTDEIERSLPSSVNAEETDDDFQFIKFE